MGPSPQHWLRTGVISVAMDRSGLGNATVKLQTHFMVAKGLPFGTSNQTEIPQQWLKLTWLIPMLLLVLGKMIWQAHWFLWHVGLATGVRHLILNNWPEPMLLLTIGAAPTRSILPSGPLIIPNSRLHRFLAPTNCTSNFLGVRR